MARNIQVDPEAIADFCQRYQIAKLALFGSVLRDDFGPDSDVDVLVEFQPTAQVDLFDMAAMEIELAGILRTDRRVDLRTPQDLSRYFRQQVLDTAQIQYVAA